MNVRKSASRRVSRDDPGKEVFGSCALVSTGLFRLQSLLDTELVSRLWPGTPPLVEPCHGSGMGGSSLKEKWAKIGGRL